ncbi:MAG: hypothetical protein R2706_10515 [Acidimicrobiales bacterium]
MAGLIRLFLLGVSANSDVSGDRQTLLSLMAIGLSLGGAALLGGPLVSWLGSTASRMPTAWRLVVRDSARQRTRAAAAIGAITSMFIIPTVALTLIGTEQKSSELSQRQNTAISQAATDSIQQVVGFSTDPTTGELTLTDRQRATVAQVLPGATIVSWPTIGQAVAIGSDDSAEYLVGAIWNDTPTSGLDINSATIPAPTSPFE